jgi:predicted RecA/RadA family phage recombinase
MPTYAGFDTRDYPGDDVVTAWAGGGSPFRFLGYYLKAPCHPGASYAGKYNFLKGLGWGLAILYVGQQEAGGRCPANDLSAAQGSADGLDAISRCKAEGVQVGAIVYLDVEAVTLTQQTKDYVAAWIDALLLDGTYSAGIYCHALNAIALHLLGEQCYANAGKPFGAPSFWVVRVPRVPPGFDYLTAVPAGSGVAFAEIWQGQIDQHQVSFNNQTIDPIDFSVALSADPSNT